MNMQISLCWLAVVIPLLCCARQSKGQILNCQLSSLILLDEAETCQEKGEGVEESLSVPFTPSSPLPLLASRSPGPTTIVMLDYLNAIGRMFSWLGH